MCASMTGSPVWSSAILARLTTWHEDYYNQTRTIIVSRTLFDITNRRCQIELIPPIHARIRKVNMMANSSHFLEILDKQKVILSAARQAKLADKALTMERRLKECLISYGNIGDVQISLHGSFRLNTIVNPFDADESYDVDMGVELISGGLTYLPSTYMKHVLEMLGKDFDNVEHRPYCIRANYAVDDSSPAFHLDISLYKIEGGTKYIAVKDGEWHESNPLAFVTWFEEESKAKPHLAAIVRLLKWWAQSYRTEMPSGLVLSIWVANNYMHDDRLDICMQKTVSRIADQLNISIECLRPTTPKGIDLLLETPLSIKTTMKNRVGKLATDIQNIISETDPERAVNQWDMIFYNQIPASMISLLKAAVTISSGNTGFGHIMGNNGTITSATSIQDRANVPPTRFFGN